MKEHDLVINLLNYAEIPAGTVGTIVYDYKTGYYEVEFIVNGTSILRTVSAKNLKKYENHDTQELHAGA